MRCASKQAQPRGRCGLCWLGSLHLALSWIFLTAPVLPWLERIQPTQCFLPPPNPAWCWGPPTALHPASLLPPGMVLSHPARAVLRGVLCCLPGAEPLTQAQCLLQAPGSSVGAGCSRPAAKCLLKCRITPGHLLQGAGRGGQALGSMSVPQAGRQRPAATASPCFSAPPSSATL